VATAMALLVSAVAGHAAILEEHPALEKFLFRESDSNLYFGFGVSPLSIIKNKAGYGVSIFQLHLIRGNLDWELFSASYAATISDQAETRLRAFTFRSAPKLRVFGTFSVGPVGGIEFVNFPDVQSRIRKDTLSTQPEAFSSRGLIYGFAFSENFKMGKSTSVKASQLIYRQNYSVTDSDQPGWEYFYESNALNRDKGPISPGWVFVLEFSLLH
jgi:hypothetical protein